MSEGISGKGFLICSVCKRDLGWFDNRLVHFHDDSELCALKEKP